MYDIPEAQTSFCESSFEFIYPTLVVKIVSRKMRT